MLVAAYGTLRRGARANGIIEQVGTFVNSGTITAQCRMVSLGGFPSICPLLQGMYKPRVDVYKVKDLQPLDRYEGFPHLYTRKEMDVTLDDESVVKATVYVMEDPNDTINNVEVVNGDWIEFSKAR